MGETMAKHTKAAMDKAKKQVKKPIKGVPMKSKTYANKKK